MGLCVGTDEMLGNLTKLPEGGGETGDEQASPGGSSEINLKNKSSSFNEGDTQQS